MRDSTYAIAPAIMLPGYDHSQPKNINNQQDILTSKVKRSSISRSMRLLHKVHGDQAIPIIMQTPPAST